MKPVFEPTEQTTCMKCRTATARYYGKWASEGLCRACVQGMPAGIRLKVLRDMHPADRKRWQLDGLFSGAEDAGVRRDASPGEPTQGELEKMLEAVEKGSESALQEFADKVGAKIVTGGRRSTPT